MSKLKSKLARRIMAIVLSGAMVMSNMSAYAAELSTEPETEVVSEVEETATAESQEEAVEDSGDEKAETEDSAAESSESKADEANTEAATETETSDAVESDTEAEEQTTAVETTVDDEKETTDVETTETEETTEEETTEEETTEETTEEETTEEDNKDDTPAVVGTTYTFNASEYMVTDADKTEVAEGTKIGTDNYFKVVSLGTYDDDKKGNVVKRGSDTKTKALEIAKWSSAGIQFTVKGTADAAFTVASTGSSNLSAIALVDTSGNIIKAADAVIDESKGAKELDDGSFLVYGNETTPSTITYKSLTAGTYIVVSPQNSDANRNAWVVSTSVTDSGASSEVVIETNKYSFNAGEYMVTDADKTEVAEGTKIGTEDYFKVVSLGTYDDDKKGNVVKRGSDTKTKALEIAKWSSAGIQFTVKGTADVTFKAASTGSSNLSSIALVDASGNIIKAAEAVIDESKGAKELDDGSFLVYGNETTPSTLSYTGLAAGTYMIVSPQNADANRNAWVISIDVEDSAPSGGVVVVTEDYTFNAGEYMVTDADKTEVAEGTKIGTEDYFKVVSLGTYDDDKKGNVVKRGSDTKTKALEIAKWSSAGIQFTVKGTANVTFKAASTGSSNLSSIALVDASGNIIKAAEAVIDESKGAKELDDGSFLVYGNETTPSTLSYTGITAGTYTIVSPQNADANRNAWVISIAVSDTYESAAAQTVTTVLDAATIFTADLPAGTWTDGQAVSYVNDYFTVLYSSKSKVEAKSYVSSGYWDDGYTGGYRINLGGTASTEMNAIKFTTTQDEATVTLWWKAGDAGRHVQILDESGNPVFTSAEVSEKDASYITKYKLTSKGTYYIGNAVGNNYLFKLSVTEGHVDEPIEWSEVAAPVILSAEQTKNSDGSLSNKIEVKVQVVIDEFNGCEKVTVNMYDSADATEPVDSVSSARETETDTTVTFTVEKSGTYYFVAEASRSSEATTKNSERFAMTTPFTLPLTTPSITRATNDGKGGMEIAYSETAEAAKYVAKAVAVTKNDDGTYTQVEGVEAITAESTETTAKLTGLTVGQYYAFTVHAVRGEGDESSESEAFYHIVKSTAEQVWDYSSFGESTTTNTAQCGYSGNVNDGEVSVWSLDGKGKIVPASTDGVSFLYTKIDKDTNFVLEATAYVDEWTYSNGQDGFGLMVADTVGPHGHGTKFWNNSYMAVATKMEYYWNGSTVLPTSVGAGDDRVRYNMYLGLGSIARTGVTDEWEAESAAGATIPSKFVSEQLSLEHAAGSKNLATGDYNVIGNAKISKSGCIDVDPLTEIRLRIEKNNTGYFVTYIDKDGEETTHKFYEDRAIVDKDYANQSLLQIDKENMYVGFFAARNAKVTFRDIVFETSSVDDGGEPEERPITYNAPTYSIVSGTVSNTPEYEINFNTNWNGTLSIKDSAGRELVGEEYFNYAEKEMTTVLSGGSYVETSMLDKFFVYEKDEDGKRISGTEKLKADVKVVVPVSEAVNKDSMLSIGANVFTVSFTPDKTWHKNDDELQMLSSYDKSVQTLTVSYRQYGEEGNNIYVATDGKSTGDGTQEAPLDIFTAVKYAQPGQTIVLKAGTYSLKKVLTIERGVDGTAEKPIRMIAEPGSYDRTNPFAPSGVVIDFNGVASGMTIAGDYWYLRGFDVIKSSDGNKGLQVSGSHNVLDQVNTYYNGNTGIQLSRYKGTDIDKSDDWPSDNLILNCTSYLNRDSGEEDADGFAAKLTIGDGNVFDGCIAAYNADDGWDFFAKSESGPIGQVVIQNSVTFKNGYKLLNENGELDIEGTEVAGRGNGNGFKMGGESIKGYHLLRNSYSFYNKAKGIDSNSCPDIQAYNCISFNNQNYNIAFYTGVASYTEYRAENVISFRTGDVTVDDGAVNDSLKPVTPSGATDLNDYQSAANFYWNNEKGVAENKDGVAVTADWFKSIEYKGIHTVSRNADGTINLGDFLALSDKADTSYFVKLEESTNSAGAKIYKAVEGEADMPGVEGQPSNDADGVVDPDMDTKGDVISNDNNTASSDIWSEDEFEQLDTVGDTLTILLNLNRNSEGYYADYTGSAIKPTVRVAHGTDELSTKNYTVTYKNHTKAYELRPGDEGFDENLAPTVVIKGKGNYVGEYKVYYVINKIDLSGNKVPSADITTVATGKAQKINPTITYNGKKLTAKDYAVTGIVTESGETYSGSYELPGTYYINLEALSSSNFKGTKTVTVRVLSAEEAASMTSMSKVKVSKISNQIYDGEIHEPEVTVNGLTKDKDYTVDYYNNTEVGVASVVLTGIGSYYGTKTVTFKIVARPFNVKEYSVTVSGRFNGETKTATTDAEYRNLVVQSSGTAVTFSNVKVMVDSTGKELVEGVDYTVSYKNNYKAGYASVVIKGKGNFKGSMSKKFKIMPYEINDSNATIEVADCTYTKGGAKPSVIVKVDGKVVSPDNYFVKYQNNARPGTASVYITGRRLLSGRLSSKTFKIDPKKLSEVNVTAENVYYIPTVDKEGKAWSAYATDVVVMDGDKKLSRNNDYTVEYYDSNNFDAKTGTVTGTPLGKKDKIVYNGANQTIYAVITSGKNGCYTGSTFASYRVVGKNDLKYAKAAKVTEAISYSSTGTWSDPTLSIQIRNRELNENGNKYVTKSEWTKLKINEDYEIIDRKNNDKVGTCTLTIRGKGYYAGTMKVTCKITRKDLAQWND